MRLRLSLSFAVVAVALAGCPIAPSEPCQKYVACHNEFAADFGGTQVDTEIYEEGGECWMNAQSAESCTVACENAVEDIVIVTEDTDAGVPPACE